MKTSPINQQIIRQCTKKQNAFKTNVHNFKQNKPQKDNTNSIYNRNSLNFCGNATSLVNKITKTLSENFDIKTIHKILATAALACGIGKLFENGI